MPGLPDSSLAGDEDAPWVFVTSKKKKRGGRRNAPNPLTFHTTSPGGAPAPLACKAPPNISVESGSVVSLSVALSHIQADHARITAWWREQPSYQQLMTLVSGRTLDHAAVTKAICLGAGSFGGPLDGGEAFRRAHLQTAAFLDMVDQLRQGGQPIPCYFQEPMYTDADKNYIQSLGHTVVEAPIASRMVTDTSLVFAIHFPLRDYLEVLSGVLPAMLVGTGYSTCEGLPSFSVDSKSLLALGPLRAVDNTFDAYRFPQDKQDYCFSDTLIYWQRRDIEQG